MSLQRPSLAVGTKPYSRCQGGTQLSLRVPALDEQLLQLFDVSPSAPTVFTPRVIGTAVARYNFAARDMRELSLREGDVVKIYSRIGGDQGWWKGETNGRVSSLPGLRALCGGPGLALLRGQGCMPLALTQTDSTMPRRDLGTLSEISLGS